MNLLPRNSPFRRLDKIYKINYFRYLFYLGFNTLYRFIPGQAQSEQDTVGLGRLGFTGDGVLSSPTNKGTLEHLAFSSTGGAGPFTVYIDDVESICEVP